MSETNQTEAVDATEPQDSSLPTPAIEPMPDPAPETSENATDGANGEEK